eukprot:4919992-Alexandrium_andersonii.AAC.1
MSVAAGCLRRLCPCVGRTSPENMWARSSIVLTSSIRAARACSKSGPPPRSTPRIRGAKSRKRSDSCCKRLATGSSRSRGPA